MPLDQLSKLTLIRAQWAFSDPFLLPDRPGVYLFFVRGGTRLLQATSYFELGGEPPAAIWGKQHLYTGAGRNLRERLKQHMTVGMTNSSMRLSLLAMERKRHAISRSGTSDFKIRGERSLIDWLFKNSTIGIEIVAEPFVRERQLLEIFPSPLNIAHRRNHPFARVLSDWRQSCFPASLPERARRVRYL